MAVFAKKDVSDHACTYGKETCEMIAEVSALNARNCFIHDPWRSLFVEQSLSNESRNKEVSRSIVADSSAKGENSMTKNVITPQNVSGFVVGEGCFYVEFGKDQKYLLGVRVRPSFTVELAEDDEDILCSMQEIIGCGSVYHLDYGRYQKYHQKKWKKHVKYKVSNITDIATKLIPFFEANPLFGKKARAFAIFRSIVQSVLSKEHLTDKGLKKIAESVQKLHIINKRGTEDSLDAREALVQWGANQCSISQSPPVTSRESVAPEAPRTRN